MISEWIKYVDRKFSTWLGYKYNIKRTLHRTKLFAALNRNQFKALIHSLQIKQFVKNEIICREGDVGDYLYIMLSGEAVVYIQGENGEETIIHHLHKDDYFGEQALLDLERIKRNANVKSVSDSTLICIDHKILHQFLDQKTRERLKRLGEKQLIDKLGKTIGILKTLSTEMINELSGNMVDFENGDVIFRKGDPSDYVYFIISGRIKIILDDARADVFTTLENNQIFGELGVLNTKNRSGSAIADGKVKVIRIKQNIFYKLYSDNPKLRDFVGALNKIYESPQRGFVSIHHGMLEGMETVNAIFKFHNKVVIASQVLGQDVFMMKVMDKSIQFKKNRFEKNLLSREILIANNVIVGVTVHGNWNELGVVCGMILDEIKLGDVVTSHFKKTGSLRYQADIEKDVVCYCMHVNKKTLGQAIKQGCDTVEKLCEETGAGTICGSCRYNIKQYLDQQL